MNNMLTRHARVSLQSVHYIITHHTLTGLSVAMVGVDSGSLYRQTHSLSHLAWVFGRRPLGAVLHSSNEPGELSQWLCHDDSTINIGICIIIIIN